MKDYTIRIAKMERKLETLEKKIKQLGDELIEHVSSPHTFCGHQEEQVDELRKRLEL